METNIGSSESSGIFFSGEKRNHRPISEEGRDGVKTTKSRWPFHPETRLAPVRACGCTLSGGLYGERARELLRLVDHSGRVILQFSFFWKLGRVVVLLYVLFPRF